MDLASPDADNLSRFPTRNHAQESVASFGRPRHRQSREFHIRPPSIRRRVASVQTSANPSPGPAHSFATGYHDSRRSVAIAASAHGHDAASRNFSLAGPLSVETQSANQPYVDPGYAQLNPAYDQPSNVRPVWSLAKPLPRVLRPGMVPSQDEVEQEVQEQREAHEHGDDIDIEHGRLEPTLLPDRITSQLDSLRRERELSLFRTYHYLRPESPSLSPLGPRRENSEGRAETSEQRVRIESPIREESEENSHRSKEPSELELPQLQEAIENVRQAREEEALKTPYRDAIPLPAYSAEEDEIHNLHTYWSVVRLRFREPLAELLGITVQYTLGFCANLSMTVSRGAAGANDTGDWAWGLSTMLAIYVAGGISGAHLNPAISFMLYIYRGFPLRKLPSYIVAQFVGAFLATFIAYGIYQPGLITLYAPQLRTQDIDHPERMPVSLILPNFITCPRAPWVTDSTAFLTEMTGTTILVVAVLALGDDTNAPPGAGMNAFIVGLLVTVLSMSLGSNTGLAMNPMRDFGPRVAMVALGYGQDGSLFADGYWFRVAWMGPILGAILGGFLYDGAIFVGGESPVNYPATRVRRATRKWKKRWRARFKRTKKTVDMVKDDVVRTGYEAVGS